MTRCGHCPSSARCSTSTELSLKRIRGTELPRESRESFTPENAPLGFLFLAGPTFTGCIQQADYLTFASGCYRHDLLCSNKKGYVFYGCRGGLGLPYVFRLVQLVQ